MWKKWAFIAVAFLVACVVYTKVTRKEGMSERNKNPEEVAANVKAASQQKRDELNVQHYRAQYEDIIDDAEMWAQRQRLSLLTKPFTKDPALVQQFNDLSSFIVNLNDTMTWMTKD
jgi:hypothetical protein